MPTTTAPSLRWRVDRSISIGDMLVFLSLLGAGIGYVIHEDQRATRTEDAVAVLHETDSRHDNEIKDLKQDVGKKLDRLDAKLDRLIERRP